MLSAAGAFILYLYAGVYSGGGGLYPALPFTTIADIGVLCLLISSRAVLRSYRAPNTTNVGANQPRNWLAPTVLGVILTLSAFFIPFPVGCNVASSCPMSPLGAWSTIWPNTITICLGFMLAAWGWGAGRSRELSLPGLGVGMVPAGAVLLMLALRISYSTMCPLNGCLPLTGSQWWSLFWPDVVAGSLGVMLMVAGFLLALLVGPGARLPKSANDEIIHRRLALTILVALLVLFILLLLDTRLFCDLTGCQTGTLRIFATP